MNAPIPKGATAPAVNPDRLPPEVRASIEAQAPGVELVELTDELAAPVVAKVEAENAAKRQRRGIRLKSDEPAPEPRVDIKQVAASAIPHLEAICSHWLPDGKRQGHDWVARNPTRDDQNAGSFSVSLLTGGCIDHATGDQCHDIVSTIKYLDGLPTQGEAARKVAEFLGTAPLPEPTQTPKPAKKTPRAMPACPTAHPTLGRPSAQWEYRDADGSLICIQMRFDTGPGTKEFRPATRTADGWRWKAPEAPRPLYGLDRLSAHPEAPVILCEGEKASNAAAALLLDCVSIASMNGAKSPKKSDWTPLAGRRVRIWPDNDQPGADFAQTAAKLILDAGAQSVEVLDLSSLGDGLPEGWDAADALADGWTPERFAECARFTDTRRPIEWGGSANPANSANRERANTAEPDDESPLSLQEIEQLVAWAWRTKTALPSDPEGVFTYHHTRDSKGRPKERYSMRSPIGGFETFSGPWPAMAWKHGREGFMGAVDAYLPVREQHVLDEAARTGKAPNDVSRDVLRADAQAWMRRIEALAVSDEVGRELLERVTPDWPEPEPLRAPMAEAEPYPVNALGDVLGTAAIALHESVKAPLALCAQSVLAAASFAAQGHFDAHMPWGEIKPLSLAMLTVGESGERKSGVDDLVLGAAKAQERAEMATYEADMESFESEMAAWKAASEQAKKRASGKDRGRLEDFRREAAEIGPPPVAPVLPLRFVTDPTVEGLYKLLAIGQPSVALFSDEGGLLIGGHALNSDNALKTLARWCKLWDGSPFDRVRAGDGSGILYGRRMALHQLAQPDIMSTLLSDPTANGQGFLARCLVAWPQSTIGTRHIEQYEWAGDRPEIRRLFGKLKTLFETPPRAKDQRGQVLDPQPLPLSPDAKAMAVQAGNQFESLMAPGAPLCEIRDRGSKAMDNAIRIAGVLTVIEQGLAAREISADHFARALTLIQWYLAEALRIRGAAAIPQAVTDAEALLAWIRERRISLFRSAPVLTRGPAQLRNKARFTAAVAELVGNGYLVEAPPGTEVEGVKAKLAWRVHPHVL
ncbi:DUF3987 domain-containing protein [Allochromatium humboldtianum]|uniref:DUF3987 domain-containing protein n=1 Tax=Allochromatium humboldtianum TaxID=504901 RepID=A0A850R663_9GAMM|nr:DUF3987 domain-containing protein [Allochromatium humboldtianum]NVZ08828.1 DUF3987 domain-containing protein [Allochromatium humboldtianum]